MVPRRQQTLSSCQWVCRRPMRNSEVIPLLRLSLDPKKGDPRVADTLIRISERVAKLHGLDAPQRIETTGKDGGPIETKQTEPDFDKLTLDELLQYEELHRKAHGLPTREAEYHVIDEGPNTRKWYAAQRAAETQLATSPGTS